MKANLQKIFCQATLHYPCSSHHCITTNNGIAFLSNYPANLSAPSPQLFNLVRFGHKCFSSSRSHHKNVQFWERLRDCADSSLFSTSGLLHLSPVRLHLFTALSTGCWRRDVNRNRKLKVSYSRIWKTSTAAVLSPPTETLNVNVWRALSK